MAFRTEVFPDADLNEAAADRLASELAEATSFVVTGGTTAERVYAALATRGVRWGEKEILFSDERCVPPTDPASNFGMVDRLLFATDKPRTLHRMKGEDDPESAASDYGTEIADVVRSGIDLVYLGLGADAHVGAMFPGSRALDATSELCAAVDRPDGMRGLTLTPPAMLSGRKVLLVAAGRGKAEAVRRIVAGNERPSSCPARLLEGHPDVTFLLDEAAASRL
ncbi:MAG TPA: 6-phosphogluconolactonase [Actinomycetota bacterium]|nr:6-phosphogluconolactonase [Actinomycetota bacterium]